MVSLDAEKVDAVILQPDSTCCFKCFKPTTAVQDELSHRVSNAPRTLSTTSLDSYIADFPFTGLVSSSSSSLDSLSLSLEDSSVFLEAGCGTIGFELFLAPGAAVTLPFAAGISSSDSLSLSLSLSGSQGVWTGDTTFLVAAGFL